MPSKTSILVITNSSSLKNTIKDVVVNSGLVKILGEAHNINAAMDMAASSNYDVFLLDSAAVKSSDIALLQRIIVLQPIPIIFLADNSKQGLALSFEAIKSGAVEFFFKEDINKDNGRDLIEKVVCASRLEISQLDLPAERKSAPSLPQKKRQEIVFCEDCGARNIFETVEDGVNEERHCAQCGDLLETNLINHYKRTNYITIITAGAGSYSNLLKIIPKVSSGLGGSIIIILSDKITHVDLFTKYLASISAIKVQRLTNGLSIEGGYCYIAASAEGFYMKPFSTRNTMESIGEVPGQDPVDLLLESTAAVFKNNTVVLFLSGFELEGAKGLNAVTAQKGVSAVLFSANCLHRQMGENILRRCKVDKIVNENDATLFITELHDTVHDSKSVA